MNGTLRSMYILCILFIFRTELLHNCIVFMQEIPDHTCYNELFSATNWTFAQIRSISAQVDTNGKYSKCSMYDFEYSALGAKSYEEGLQYVAENVSTNATTSCHQGWYYDRKAMTETMATQWDLVCDRSVQVANAQMVYMIGFFIGVFTSGPLADRFGRKKVIVIYILIASIASISNSLVPNYYAFLVVRLIMGVFLNGGTTLVYVLAMEYCNDAFRRPLACIYFISYSVGYAALAFLAYLIKDWKLLHVVGGCLYAVSVVFYWTLPESPRWLASKGRYSEAKAIIEKGIRMNGGVKLSEYKDENANQTVRNNQECTIARSEKTEKLTFFALLRYPRIVLRTLNVYFNWFVNAFVYYGISLLVTSFAGNIFVNNAIAGAVETPGYLICWPLLYWGRQKGLMLTLIMAGLSILLYLPIPADMSWLQITVAMIGKLCITASFNIVLTVEIYPTPVRSAAMTSSSMAGRFGSVLAPYVAIIAAVNKDLTAVPMVIFGAASLAAGTLTYFLPESKDRPLPETLEDTLHFPKKPWTKNRDENAELCDMNTTAE